MGGHDWFQVSVSAVGIPAVTGSDLGCDIPQSVNQLRYTQSMLYLSPTCQNFSIFIHSFYAVSMKSLLLGNEWTTPTTNCRGVNKWVLVNYGSDLWLTGNPEPFLYTKTLFSTL